MRQIDMGYDEQKASFLSALGRGERMVSEGPIRVTDVSSMSSVSGRACLTTDQLAFWTSENIDADFQIMLDNVQTVDATFDDANQLSKIDVLHRVNDRLLKSTFFCSLDMGRSLKALTEVDETDDWGEPTFAAAAEEDVLVEHVGKTDSSLAADSIANRNALVDDGDSIDDDFHWDLERLASTMEVDEDTVETPAREQNASNSGNQWSTPSTSVATRDPWESNATDSSTGSKTETGWWGTDSLNADGDANNSWWDDDVKEVATATNNPSDDIFGTSNLFSKDDADEDSDTASEHPYFNMNGADNGNDLFAAAEQDEPRQRGRKSKEPKAPKEPTVEKAAKEPKARREPKESQKEAAPSWALSSSDNERAFATSEPEEPRKTSTLTGYPRLAAGVAAMLAVLLATVLLSQVGPFNSDSDSFVNAAATSLRNNPTPQTGADVAKEQAANNIIERDFSLIQIQQNNEILDRLGIIVSMVVSVGTLAIGILAFRLTRTGKPRATVQDARK